MRLGQDHHVPTEKLILLSGALIVSAGVRSFDEPMRVNAMLPSGVKVVTLLSGRLLAGLVISSCMAQASATEVMQLSARDIDRVRQARELLIGALQHPPSLEGLAAQVGLNVRKLNDGFRRVYGATVFGFLQEYRLEQAYKLIAAGEMSVSEAAYHVGYGAAHFSTIFRKRFGISPSSLR